MQSNNSRQDRQELVYLPVPFPKAPPRKVRFAALRTWWTAAWEEGGVLHEMWDDVLSAPRSGLRHMAPWLRAVLMVAAVSFVVLMARAAGEVVLQQLHQLLTAVPRVQVGVDTSSGVAAVVDQPVRTYIAQHSAGLPVAASTVYTLWLLTGITGLVVGFFTRSTGVRAMWTGWGAASVFMVWTATPPASRPVAAALAVLAWAFLSAFALRGLTLRRRVVVGRPAQVTVRPEIHIPAPAAPADDRPHSGCPFRD
ncbi:MULTISPECIES: hypothetical protein [Streptomyces]|uniref:hypothetical protein n=1 Tax=Streptomyces TaxID=1883 RepID=UPI0016776EE2|nr:MULTISPECIES: hypothetical protein [Streptomyces]MBK3521966.1 hypothetical protein [Streptomyces sp. MBT70]GGS09203.1 hypothetical protein GCM10010236_74540 [Streptomyces eurythermus]